MDYATGIAGFLVGSVVGLTGVGGGALMTPLLVLLFGVAPHTAVGTDLLFACCTKSFGVAIHRSHGTVDWQIVKRLSLGSLPAAAATLAAMAVLAQEQVRAGLILHVLGAALLLTAAGLLLKERLHAIGRRFRIIDPKRFKGAQPGLTVLVGAVLGVLVTLTSIGAGAVGTVALVYLYPFRLTPARLVGTDLAHAIPLALVAGLGHLVSGNVDFVLLGNLLLGSIPGIMFGATLSTRAPERWVRGAVAVVLSLVAAKLLT